MEQAFLIIIIQFDKYIIDVAELSKLRWDLENKR